MKQADALDFWQVESVEDGHPLRLRAEMRVPGKAWLQFQVTPREDGTSLLSQTAFFASKGLAGWLYWFALYPVHAFIFSGMIKRISGMAVTGIGR